MEENIFESLKYVEIDWSQTIPFKMNQGKSNPFYGLRHSIETKIKISESRKGKDLGNTHGFTSENTSGENNPMYGKYGIDHPAYGHKKSDEFKNNMSKRMSGVLNPMYGKQPAHTIPEEKKKEISDKFKSGMTRKQLYELYSGIYSSSTIKRAIRYYD